LQQLYGVPNKDFLSNSNHHKLLIRIYNLYSDSEVNPFLSFAVETSVNWKFV